MSRNKWRALLIGLFVIVLVVPALVGPVAGAKTVSGEAAMRTHPYVARLARERPDTFVDVIVIKQRNADESAIAKAVGGRTKRSWSFIHAMHMSLPGKAVEALASQPGVAFVAPDSPMQATAYDAAATAAHYQMALNAGAYWNAGEIGNGVGVAVIDSGAASHPVLQNRVVPVSVGTLSGGADLSGHGTHVAGVVAGYDPGGLYTGMAPGATIYSIRVTGANGQATESQVVTALEWVYKNHQAKNIRVVNLSLQSSVAASYQTSPLAGAVEKLWFAGVTVVVSAGNRGTVAEAAYFPPANDPYVITVGAMDDAGTKDWSDDSAASFSSAGLTQEGMAKPEVLAPGRGILSALAAGSTLAAEYPSKVEGDYIRLSGSSMAAPVVSGAVALMLGKDPSLTPDQVKYLLMNYGRSVPGADGTVPDLEQIGAAVDGAPAAVPEANQGLTPSSFADNSADFEVILNLYFENLYFENLYFENLYFDN
jgi:serine protease AprX